jgi:ADP-heptose:LPS heptosyltransferase
VSRAAVCQCHHKRHCRRGESPCIADIAVEEVIEAIERRLGAPRERPA